MPLKTPSRWTVPLDVPVNIKSPYSPISSSLSGVPRFLMGLQIYVSQTLPNAVANARVTCLGEAIFSGMIHSMCANPGYVKCIYWKCYRLGVRQYEGPTIWGVSSVTLFLTYTLLFCLSKDFCPTLPEPIRGTSGHLKLQLHKSIQQKYKRGRVHRFKKQRLLKKA